MNLTTTFDVPIDVYSDNSTGQDFILPSELELQIDQQAIDRMIKDIDSENSLLDDTAKVGARLQADALQKLLDRKRAFREDGLPFCKHLVYTIAKPTYLQRLQAEEAARRVDTESFVVTMDRVKLVRHLLRECIQGISKDELANLSPVIAEYLETRVNATLGGDNQLLPF